MKNRILLLALIDDALPLARLYAPSQSAGPGMGAMPHENGTTFHAWALFTETVSPSNPAEPNTHR